MIEPKLAPEEQAKEAQHDFDERAAVFEYEGNLDRKTAGRYAKILIERKKQRPQISYRLGESKCGWATPYGFKINNEKSF